MCWNFSLKNWELWNAEKTSGELLMCFGLLAKNMEMHMVLSFFSTITNFMPDGTVSWRSEWPEEIYEPSLSVWIFHVFESLNFVKTKRIISEYLILGQNHSALSQSPAITSSLDHDARSVYKIIISTFFLQKSIQTNIWTAARVKCSQGLSKTRELCKSLKLQRHSEFKVLHPSARWCIPAS